MAENMVEIMAMADLSTQSLRHRGEPRRKRSVLNAELLTPPLLVFASNAQPPSLERAARVAALTWLHRPNSVTSVAALQGPSVLLHTE